MVEFSELSDAVHYAARLQELRDFLPWAMQHASTHGGAAATVTVVVEPGTPWASPSFTMSLEPLIDRAFAGYEIMRKTLEGMGVRQVPDHKHMPPRQPIRWPNPPELQERAAAVPDAAPAARAGAQAEQPAPNVTAAMARQILDEALRNETSNEALLGAIRRAADLLLPLTA